MMEEEESWKAAVVQLSTRKPHSEDDPAASPKPLAGRAVYVWHSLTTMTVNLASSLTAIHSMHVRASCCGQDACVLSRQI
jgi:hypothetical protein